jgi:hypothetical protein
MAEEIIKDGEIIIDTDGKKWLPVLITNKALSQINKIILGDQIDEDDKRQKELRKQVHEDCLRLFKEFN